MDQNRFLSLVIKEVLAEISANEQAELLHYLREHKEKRKEYQLLKDYWENQESQASDSERIFEKVMKKIVDVEKDNELTSSNRFSLTRIKKYLIAASIVIATSLIGYYFIRYHQDEYSSHQELVTGLAKKSIILLDGTEVTLNASSKLTFPKTFRSNVRQVHLEGEAFFDVQHDESRPFIIHTADMVIKVLGTSFNVRAYADEQKTETSLISGAVEVSLPKQQNKKIRLKARDKLILKKTQLTKSKNEKQKILEPTVELAKITYYKPKDDTSIIETSWLQNKLAFKNETFGNIAERLEKHFGVNIHFESQKIRDYKFNGVFEQENVQQILHALHLAAPFGYRIQGKEILIYN